MSDDLPSANVVQHIEIDADFSGQRIDNFLMARLRGVPRSLVYRILRSGEVRINGGRCKASQRLNAGDRVRVPPVRLPERGDAARAPEALLKTLARSVLYEDDDLLVVNKPSGLAVHGGSGIKLGLIEALRQMRPECRSLELVHRLDRDTSGCILITKKRAALRHLHAALRDGGVEKVYVALVKGRWPRRKTRVEAPLQKNVLASGERMVRVSDDGKRSRTLFSVLACYPNATLVEARPITGRTHQIRVHAGFAGHPLAGDEKYGDRDFDHSMKTIGLKRLFLHAAKLSFNALSGDRISVEAPLDDELLSVLDRLNSVVGGHD